MLVGVRWRQFSGGRIVQLSARELHSTDIVEPNSAHCLRASAAVEAPRLTRVATRHVANAHDRNRSDTRFAVYAIDA
jgi:hypothetical protein